ncbi:hypothetical protein B0H66DRAFT_545131 [Apodospora peruviana]|uniref:Uncharacterized protein n=1 Tax=Apodospora peruviana TaxID=516989 RepID=A0AAE0HRZ8_9PEZI|nr:hypothetical protein B0H66DRAFT_571382 [Apodospora peruviana]KAK3330885.1 hypothetical protein B0H66DRAFT_545131 [Apodospora peruviana]
MWKPRRPAPSLNFRDSFGHHRPNQHHPRKPLAFHIEHRLLSTRAPSASLFAPKTSRAISTTTACRTHQSKRSTFATRRTPRRALRARLLFATAAAAVSITFFWASHRPFSNTNNTMGSKLAPSNPSEVMVIRNITPNIVTFSVPFSRFGRLPVGGRGTLVRLTSGALAVFSPVALTPEAKAKVAELGGNVRYIVAPDIEHHIFVTEWAQAYPDAVLVGPEGLPEKRAKMSLSPENKNVGKEPFAAVFTAKNKRDIKIAPDFDADFEYEFFDSHPNKELAFFYKPDRVLIQADLLFNLPADEQYSCMPEADKPKNAGLLARIFMSLQSAQGEAKWQKRFLWYAASSKNRDGFNTSVRRVAAWDFNTIVPCHGDTVVGGGKALFEKVFEWHLKGRK